MTNSFKSIDDIQVSDLITKVYGKKPIEVTEIIYDNYVNGIYIDSNNYVSGYFYDFKPYEPEEDNTMSKQQLFTWTDDSGQHYGTLLATNSNGDYVIEEKKTGNIVTKDKSAVEEVLPYTFSAKCGISTNEKHFIGTDTIKKGDILIQNSTMKYWTVTAVDTKNKNATKFVGRRIVTEKI
jgi:hypothetical protein